jgi:UDP-3-O-[3-hydroxymyristoyl] glucosamine N-acyltransferase
MRANVPEKTLEELAALTSTKLVGDPKHRIASVNALDDATGTDATFLANSRYREAMQKTKAGVICVDTVTPLLDGKNFLISEDPSRSFQIIAELFHSLKKSAFVGIHPTAVIDPSAVIGNDVSIGPYAVIDCNVRIGDRSLIDAHTFIGADSEIGEECHLFPFSVVREGCRLGKRVILQSGAVIGSCGFGYVTDKQGKHQKLEQLGIVILEDDVEIGANTTIDRARFKCTLIRRGTKIDNLVQIAHNVEVGADNLIAAQTGIAGSAKTGHHVMLGGQVGVLGHVELDDLTMIATRGGVSKSLKAGKYRGSPAIPITEYNRQEVHVRRLEEYALRIKALEEKLAKFSSP